MILSFAFFTVAQENASTDNNIFLDSDQDGLSDEEEKTYGTDPFKADTDGDGYSDGAEVKSGYDPKKPAPGDRIGGDKETAIPAAFYENEGNMTNDLMERVTAMVESSAGTGENIGMMEIENTIQEILETEISEEDIPTINKDGIKVKLQNYDNLSSEKRKAKEKEDFIKYLTSVTYIISSNSPRAVTTELDAQRVFDSLTKGAISAITTGNTSGLRDIIASAEKSLVQMEDVEVPEKEIDLHVKGLTFLNYALTFKNGFRMSYTDPLADMVELSKMQSFMESLATFSFEVQERFVQYGIDLQQPMGLITDPFDDSVTGTAAEEAVNNTDTTDESEADDAEDAENSDPDDETSDTETETENDSSDTSDTNNSND